MSDRRRIHVGELGSALESMLERYSQEVQDGIVTVTERNMKDLVKKTKATAPRGRRKGQFRKNITADYQELRRHSQQRGRYLAGRTVRATWYVKAPDYRLTHLIVHGHEKTSGGRTRSNPFLQDALDQVLPNYEREIEEVLTNG